MSRAGIARAALALLALVPVAALHAQSDARATLDSLAGAYWTTTLDYFPEYATRLGLPGERNGRLTDRSPEAIARYHEALRGIRRRVLPLDPAALPRASRIHRVMLLDAIDNTLGPAVCRDELWDVNQLDGYQVLLPDLAAQQRYGTAEERALAIRRWQAMPAAIDRQVANLRLGLRLGYRAPRILVERVLGQLDAFLQVPADSSPLVTVADLAPAAEREGLRAALLTATRDGTLPAFRRYRDFLRDTYLPQARASLGVGQGIPNGAACYRARIRAYTSLVQDPAAVHRIGLEEVRSIRAEMAVIARRRFGTENVDSLLVALRTDPAMAFTSREEVEEAARSAVARMEALLPSLVGTLPERRVEVERMPAYQEQDGPAAYYYPAAADNSRPGRYRVNTYRPDQRPRATAEALAFHEAVPGHHLQGALSQELPLPEFLRQGGSTAFVEGWALYTERLADEAGAYSDDLSRLGMLMFQSWRACRLVVDTGIHQLGWSRQRAIDYMLRYTGLSAVDVANEVDRYILWPGQALAYKTGQREIEALRREAERRLGSRFDRRRFHDVILADGAVTLPLLRATVERWIADGGR